MSDPIPRIYRVQFVVIDAILTAIGTLCAFFASDTLLRGITPAALLPPAVETAHYVHAVGAYSAGLFPLHVILLRARPQDVQLWKIVQFSIMLIDILMLYAWYPTLAATGRLDPAVWGFDEWVNVAITLYCGLIRAAFVLGVGLGEGIEVRVKKSR